MLRRWLLLAWPRNLAGRTVLLLLTSLTVFHLGSLWMHQHDLRGTVAELDEARVADKVSAAALAIMALPADERDHAAHAASDPGISLGWSARAAVVVDDPAAGSKLRNRLARQALAFSTAKFAPWTDYAAGIRGSVPLPDGTWLNLTHAPRTVPAAVLGATHTVASTTFMAVGIVAVSVLLIRWLTSPLRRLAEVADGMGRGRTVSVPLDGPTEVQRLAQALDAMQARLLRLMDDRTRALAAVSHDLRTPITRLRLRAGFLDAPEIQASVDADLDEMEGMIAATLTYLSGETEAELPQLTDVAVLLATLCDTASDTGQAVTYDGPGHFDAPCRRVALRRAVSNLIGNAVTYGGGARVCLVTQHGGITITVEDDGPGIPDEALEQVFEPFHRLDLSRNRRTGGVGLGLTIARQAAQEHGGTLTLSNRPGGGLRATILVPSAPAPPTADGSRKATSPATNS